MLRGGTPSSAQPVGFVCRPLAHRRKEEERGWDTFTGGKKSYRAKQDHEEKGRVTSGVLREQPVLLQSPRKHDASTVGFSPQGLGGHISTILPGLSRALTHRNGVRPSSSGSNPGYHDNELCIKKTKRDIPVSLYSMGRAHRML